jgi:hypothetical protein
VRACNLCGLRANVPDTRLKAAGMHPPQAHR